MKGWHWSRMHKTKYGQGGADEESDREDLPAFFQTCQILVITVLEMVVCDLSPKLVVRGNNPPIYNSSTKFKYCSKHQISHF